MTNTSVNLEQHPIIFYCTYVGAVYINMIFDRPVYTPRRQYFLIQSDKNPIK